MSLQSIHNLLRNVSFLSFLGPDLTLLISSHYLQFISLLFSSLILLLSMSSAPLYSLLLLLTLFSRLAPPTHLLFYQSEFLVVNVCLLCLAFSLEAPSLSLCYCFCVSFFPYSVYPYFTTWQMQGLSDVRLTPKLSMQHQGSTIIFCKLSSCYKPGWSRLRAKR